MAKGSPNPIRAVIWLVVGLIGLSLLAVGFVFAIAKDSVAGYKILPASEEWFRETLDKNYPAAPEPIPDEENLYVALVKIGGAIPRSRRTPAQVRRFDADPLLKDPAHRSWVESFLERCGTAVAELRSASKKYNRYRFNDEEDENRRNLRSIDWALNALQLDAQLNASNGNRKAALEDVFATFRLVNTICAGNPSASDFYYATDRAREARAELVEQIPKLSRTEAAEALALIPATPVRDEDLKRSLLYGSRIMLEYLHRVKTLDWLRSYGSVDPRALVDYTRAGTLDETETVKDWIELMQVFTANCERPWREIDHSPQTWLEQMRKEFPERPAFSHVSTISDDIWEAGEYRKKLNKIPNARGKMFLTTYADYAWTVSHSFYRRTGASSTRTRLAVRLYGIDHKGNMPPSLKDLVRAGYLEGEPLDLFAGKPLRYDPARRIVWSSGPDGIDNGGKENANDPSAKSSDWVYRL